jgi:hypothetical protein
VVGKPQKTLVLRDQQLFVFIFCLFLELILSDHGNGVDKTDETCVL